MTKRTAEQALRDELRAAKEEVAARTLSHERLGATWEKAKAAEQLAGERLQAATMRESRALRASRSWSAMTAPR